MPSISCIYLIYSHIIYMYIHIPPHDITVPFQQMWMNVPLKMVAVIIHATTQLEALNADVTPDTHWLQMVEHAMVRSLPVFFFTEFIVMLNDGRTTSCAKECESL